MTMLATLLIGAFLAMAFIFRPIRKMSRPLHLEKTQKILNALEKYERLLYEKERLLENIVEADSDFRFEKMNAADHENLKGRLFGEANKIYEEIDRIEKTNPFFQAVETDLQNLRGEI